MATYKNAPPIVTSGLVFNLDAGNAKSYPRSGTTWNDLAGAGYNGTLTNGPTYTSADGGAVVFDGTNDYVITNNTVLDLSTDKAFSYGAWIRPSFNNTSGTGRAILDFTGNAPTYYRSYLRWEGSSLGFYFDIADNNGGSAFYTSPAPTFAANTWHYIAFTHTAGNVGQMYFDGLRVNTANLPWYYVAAVNNKITVGYGAINNYYWAGNISNVHIYTKVLTLTEIQQNYNALKSRFGL